MGYRWYRATDGTYSCHLTEHDHHGRPTKISPIPVHVHGVRTPAEAMALLTSMMDGLRAPVLEPRGLEEIEGPLVGDLPGRLPPHGPGCHDGYCECPGRVALIREAMRT